MPIIRNISSIVNRTNNCGGNKKAGLAPSVGGRSRFAMKTVKVNAVNTIPVVKCGSGGRGCPRNFSNNPGGQACGGVGRMAQLATRGIVPPGGRGERPLLLQDLQMSRTGLIRERQPALPAA